MKTATTSKPFTRALPYAVALAALIAVSMGAGWWTPAPAPLTTARVLALLPPGSTIHSFARLEMDGRPPAEAAVVAAIPLFPGSREIIYTSLIFRYDGRRRAYVQIYRASSPGRVPFSADAVRLLGSRDAAVFSGLNDDGSREYQVVGLAGRRLQILRAQRFTGSLLLADPLLIERRGNGASAVRWNGRAWVDAEVPVGLRDVPSGLTWRYAVRKGTVRASTSIVHVQPRQTIRILAAGGGSTSIIVPDARLDVMEAGYRQRTPGTYAIRIVTGFQPIEEAYALTVVVDP